MTENKSLQSQIEDMRITLQINKDFLFKYIAESKQTNSQDGKNLQNFGNFNLLSEVQEENNRLNNKISELYKEKEIFEKKVSLFHTSISFILFKILSKIK